jgi:hypothetical protein
MHRKNLLILSLLLGGSLLFAVSPAQAQSVGTLAYYDLTPERIPR